MKIWNALTKVAEKTFIAFAMIFTVVFFTFLFLTDHAGCALFLLALLIYDTFKRNH